ncbi:uncharacterized protein BO66DRAFT_395634 [Aspergillus aculeatinus CBS 121060]|uniref:Uncharacterized protein n=1 Tax=Aspergillus aculeatinus CBS 121060 TaxID=1448322 RepID=A0ACD1GUW9_9EURO|nr:hypothetical protein BO66DRAFT_395634 [Aspergillus aculeatinus CBS 121060]RAH65153.1 hypothetical protein BO66DRAFT_395634 [Aspergillus aculeatinus CBS 121060]
MNSLPPAQRRPRRRRGNPRCGPMPPRRLSPSSYQIPQDLSPSLPAIQQTACPLFTHIPAEIRNRIYYYTLESSSSSSSSSSSETASSTTYAQQALYYRPGFKAPKRISTALLQTCQQIYGEASLLPPAINRHTFWCHRPPPHVRHAASPADYFARMTPKQRGAVQELHFFTQQYFLEDSWAQVWASVRENEAWQAQMRKGKRKLEEANANTGEGGGGDNHPGDRNQVNGVEGRGSKRRAGPALPSSLGLEPDETSDVGVLAPKRLTITLRHTDWWFWEHNEPLGIDPFRPGRTKAEEMEMGVRGQQQQPQRPLTAWEEGRVWGNQFKLLPSLEELVIEFETVMRKRDQLDAIVQMARDWRFPVVVDEEENGEKVFLVAEEGSRRAYTWIGAKEEILRDVVMGAAGRGGNGPQGGDAGDAAAVRPPPRLVPFDAEQEFKTAAAAAVAASQSQKGEGDAPAEQSEPKSNRDFDPATEEKFYVVFLTWRRQRIN